MTIAYFTDIRSIHGHSWISHFAAAHRVLLLCEKDAPAENLYSSDKRIQVYPVLPKTYPLRNISERFAAVKEVKKILQAQQVTVAHSMYALPYAFWPWHAGFKNHIATTRGSDVLVHFRNNKANAKNWKERLIHAALDRRMIRSLAAAAYITCTSEQQMEVVKTMVQDHNRIRLVRTGVDTEMFLRHCRRQKPEGAPVLLSNRAMTPLYNIHLLLEALGILRQNGNFPGIRLILLNYQTDAAYFSRIEKLIRELQLENVVDIREKLSPEKLAATYDECHAVVMAPQQDGSPVSGIEALLAGKPLLLPSLPYDNAIFRSAWKFREYTAASIAAAITEMLQAPAAGTKAQSGYEDALAHADRKTQLAKVEELYQKLAAGS